MAVEKYTRQRDGRTIYLAVFRTLDGRKLKRTVKGCSVAPDARQKDHARARTKAEQYAYDQRAMIEAGTWTDPRDDQPKARLTFGGLVKKFLRDYQSRSGGMVHYECQAATWLKHIPCSKPAAGITVQDVDRFRLARSRGSRPEYRQEKPDLLRHDVPLGEGSRPGEW